ncbi:MAG: DUF1287 domain-containing protein [Pseudodesulfovibrio sp.]
MHRFAVILLFATILFGSVAFAGQGSGSPESVYVLKPMVNLRDEPRADSPVLASIARNTSLICLGARDGWLNVVKPGHQPGWVRADLLSHTVIHIHKNERQLVVMRGDTTVLTMPVNPGKKGLGDGRYFAVPSGKRLVLSWPNRQDIRTYLKNGKMDYLAYRKVILGGAKAVGGGGLSLCSGAVRDKSCGVVLSPGDFSRLMAEIPGGARVEIYANSDADRDMNRPDELSQRIHMGALEQLKRSAAGLSSYSRAPSIDYPGGDIQPDFAASADIVIRAVRHAGLDLQALVHEDVLLHPDRYSALNVGSDDFASHRLVPVLFEYLRGNAMSLPVDIEDNPFGFEAGDIVVFATGSAGENVPDRVGVVDDTFNAAGHPLVVAVWDMGQTTSRMDLLGRKNKKVVGHFRMTHLFDYQ